MKRHSLFHKQLILLIILTIILLMACTHTASAALSALYADEFPQVPYTAIFITADYSGQSISAMTPDAFPNIGALLAATNWDFSGNDSGSYSFTTQVPINSSTTCAFNACGFRNPDNSYYLRVDNAGRSSGMPLRFNGTDTYFARAFLIDENTADENFICIDGSSSHGTWMLYQFPHFDGTRYYLQLGDSWGTSISCKQDLFMGTTCGAGGLGAYADGRTDGDVIQSGVATLPSGHILDAIVVRTEIFSENYLDAFCMIVPVPAPYEWVRMYQITWLVPHLGIVAQVVSGFDAPDPTSWTVASASNFGIGLYPPLSISLDSKTTDSITISWNPGNITTYIDDYKVYWDGTESGSLSSYDFNSDTHPAQVSFAGTQATISGLNPGQTYYITITSRYTYLDPKSSISTTYESIQYPVTVSGAPTHTYPVELTVDTETSGSPTSTLTPLPTSTPTQTFTPTNTSTLPPPTPTNTPSPTYTVTSAPTNTATSTFSPTLTPTNTTPPTATNTSLPTDTYTPAYTPLPSITPTQTPTSAPTTIPSMEGSKKIMIIFLLGLLLFFTYSRLKIT